MPDRVGRSGETGPTFAVRDVGPAEVAARFPLGRIVEGRIVRDFGGGRYLLAAGGLRLVAEAPEGFAEGTLLRLRVRAHEPRLHLERLPAGDEAADRALRRAGLPADAETRRIVRALAGRGLPIDRETVEALRSFLRASGARPETGARLLARGLPLDPALGRDVERHLAARPGGLRTALEAFVAAARAAGRTDLAEAAERALVLRAPADARSLRALAADHPARLEAALARGEAPAAGSTLALKAALTEAARGPAGGGGEAVARAAAEVVRALEIAALLGGDGEASLPLVVRDDAGEGGGAEVRVGRREEETVAFDLETTRLGRVRAFLLVRGGEAALAVGVDDAAARDHLRAGLDSLRAAFRAIGLPLAGATIDAAPPASSAPPPETPVGFDVVI